jgi:diguanylate cyclase (GGDEF)-like protein
MGLRIAPVAMTAAGRSRIRWGLWVTYGVLAVGCAGYLISVLVRPGSSYWPWLDGWLVDGIEVAGAFLCLLRGAVRPQGRGVALALGTGLIFWALGDIASTIGVVEVVRDPGVSVADLLYLGFYPPAYVAVVLFLRQQVGRPTRTNWLDGAIGGLGAAALCATFAFDRSHHSTGPSVAATVVNLAYPTGDLLLLAALVGGVAVRSGVRRAPWMLLAAGMALNAAGDSFDLVHQASGVVTIGDILNDTAWPVSILLMSIAVWFRAARSHPLTAQRDSGLAVPLLASASALAILFAGALHHVHPASLILAAATLAVAGVRLVVSVRGIRSLSRVRHHLSITDDLTGLGNRRHLLHVLEDLLADLEDPELEDRGSLAFLFMDLNDFKQINDSFGHPAGDELLRQLGPRLAASLRDSDLLVRLGGDEFAILLIDADAAYATTIATRLTASLAQPFTVGSLAVNVSASIGIALAPGDGMDSGELIRCADTAMYRSKSDGTPFARYERTIDGNESALHSVQRLSGAIETGQIVVHYQPQLDLRTGEVTGAEALVRWVDPELGLIAPDTFLPLAEEGGLMGPLTALVLGKALAQCAAWQRAGRRLTVSVNVSATNLVDPGFTEVVSQLLTRHGVPAGLLVLEVTETRVISEFERSRQVIEALQGLGAVVSIDDFGAGFTSLAYLAGLAVGELKLDRAFVVGLATGGTERDERLLGATIDLAHAIGMRVVVEGIEDPATLHLLTALGGDLAQGFLIGRPQSAADFTSSLDARTALPMSIAGAIDA